MFIREQKEFSVTKVTGERIWHDQFHEQTIFHVSITKQKNLSSFHGPGRGGGAFHGRKKEFAMSGLMVKIALTARSFNHF
jgi:hypothetical protein